MDVNGAAGVVAGHDGVKGQDAVVVAELDAAEGGVVEAVGVVGVAVAAGLDAAVDACGVAVPRLEGDVGQGLAGGGVDKLDLKGQGDTGLGVGDVLANELARDPW